MNRLQQLIKKRASYFTRMQALSATASTEDREFTDLEAAEFEKLEQDAAKASKDIDREERLREAMRAAQGVDLEDVDDDASDDASDTPVAGASKIRVGKNRAEDRPFASLGEQLIAVAHAAMPNRITDPRLHKLQASAGANTGISSEGGFLVQSDLVGGLLQRTWQMGEILKRVQKVPIGPGKNGTKFNVLKENSRRTGSRFGGIQFYWLGEGGALGPATKPEYRQLELTLRKVGALYYATEEALEDAPALEADVNNLFPKELAFTIEDVFVNGTGAGQPFGFLNSPAVVQVAIEATQTIANSAQFLPINISKMYSRMPAGNIGNAVWLINQELFPYLVTMTLGTGTGAIPVYLPPNGMADAPFGTILGRPVFPVEYCAALGTPGDIVFVDLSEYKAADKNGVRADVSMHVRFLTDEMTYRWIYRVDGQPTQNSPMTPYKGSATQSPYVTLAVRA